MRLRVGVDTGGTFTDFVILDEDSGRLDVFKVASLRGAESEAIVNGLRGYLSRTKAHAEELVFFSHGTTVGTNAMLEDSSASPGLLITSGFRGIYEVAEQDRGWGSAIYDLLFERPRPLTPPRLTGEIPERLDYRGEVVQALDEEAARQEIARLLRRGVSSVAVCLLFSFRNPAHERRVAELIREAAPDADVSLSSDVAPQIREYYRLSTTVVNAYLNPLVRGYVERLDAELRDLGVRTDQRYVMRSNGGVATFASTAARSVQTVLSGPAAGVVAGQRLAHAAGLPNAITFDMGGTSTDVALIREGRPARRMAGKVHGRDVVAPMLDVHTVAAGGGTLAWVDEAGTLQVGPRSAGAVPGPACYGRGGTEPTITDANLALGLLGEAQALAGGEVRLNRAAAEEAIRRCVAVPLGLSVARAAQGMIDVVNAKMEEAIKVISSNRGLDVRDFALLAFGGAGPLHAGRVAAELGMPEVVVPPYPGVTSALGLLLCDVRHDHVASELLPLDTSAVERVNELYQRLQSEARADLTREGFRPEQLRFEHHLDLRYQGQGYELTIAVDRTPLTASDVALLRDRFDTEHALLTGHSAPSEAVEMVNYRLAASASVPRPALGFPFASPGAAAAAITGRRRVSFDAEPTLTPVYDRSRLAAGETIDGPAILEQLDSTTAIYPGHRAVVDHLGQLRLRIA